MSSSNSPRSLVFGEVIFSQFADTSEVGVDPECGGIRSVLKHAAVLANG
jgi:hypothetical protein